MITRKYPNQPVLGVGAVILKNKKILLVQRKFEPKAGYWTLPGGTVELGETIHHALKREIREECGIEIEPQRIIDVLDVGWFELSELNGISLPEITKKFLKKHCYID